MKYNQLSATDITVIAWVHNEHPDAISRTHDADAPKQQVQCLPVYSKIGIVYVRIGAENSSMGD
jgi:hypothetical protein